MFLLFMVPSLCPMKVTIQEFISQRERERVSREGPINEFNQEIFIRQSTSSRVNGVAIVKAMVFPVVMYGCESWTVKKAEC